MGLKEKILANVKEQALINGRMSALQRQFDDLKSRMERLGGQMDLLQELFVEAEGVSMAAYFQKYPDFKQAIDDAAQEGEALAVGGALEVPTGSNLRALPGDPATGVGIVRHSGNKKVKQPEAALAALEKSAKEPEAEQEDDTIPPPTPRSEKETRQPPKIVIADEPAPTPIPESTEDAKDPTPT